jgi:hypothetical protein
LGWGILLWNKGDKRGLVSFKILLFFFLCLKKHKKREEKKYFGKGYARGLLNKID